MNYHREFDNSDDNHECIIIHYHMHFNKHLRALWYHMDKYMDKFGKLNLTKYVYYFLQRNNLPTLNLDLREGRKDFLKSYHFDLDDKLNVFAKGKYFASRGNRKLFQGVALTGFFDEACKTVVGWYKVHEVYDLPIV